LKREASKKAKDSHMNQVTKIIVDIIDIPPGYKDKYSQSYDVFLRTERYEIEKQLKKVNP
jgi:hypothetical protein